VSGKKISRFFNQSPAAWLPYSYSSIEENNFAWQLDQIGIKLIFIMFYNQH
jgi:hypothetical protein